MLIKNELNRPLPSTATHADAYSRFLKLTKIDESIIEYYKPATKPYLTAVGLRRTSFINNAIIIFLKNGEKIIYQFNIKECK